jgi:TnpA family transposase
MIKKIEEKSLKDIETLSKIEEKSLSRRFPLDSTRSPTEKSLVQKGKGKGFMYIYMFIRMDMYI